MMSIREKLEWLAIISNTLLWGGIGLSLIWLSITDPTLPDDNPAAETTPTQVAEGVENAAPRHRA